MQHYGAAAYQTTAKTIESPREREAALLIKSAVWLQSCRDNRLEDVQTLQSALTFNRKLWTVFMTSATRDENALSTAVRQNIVNLGIYILNETREILLDPVAPQRLDALININRQLAQGLRAS